MATFNILEVVRVEPSANSSDSEAQLTLPLTFFDIFCLKFPPTERVFFYRVAGLTRSRFDSEIVPRLRNSLSVTLNHYRPVAGQLVWDPQDPKPCVRCSQKDGVLFRIAESTADFIAVSGDGTRPVEELRQFVPELLSSNDSASVLSVQITLFPDQGFCIGVIGNHAVLDGKTTAMFVKTWAHISKNKSDVEFSLPHDLIPSFDRTVIRDQTSLDLKILKLWVPSSKSRRLKIRVKEIADDSVRAVFRLSRDNIEKLTDRAKTELSMDSERFHLSSFVVTYAYVFTNMVRTKGGDINRPVFLSVTVDYRNRLDPEIRTTYFGNVIGPEFMNVNAGVFMEESGFVSAVKMICGMVTGINPAKIEKNMVGFFEAFGRMKPGTQTGIVTGSNKLGIYGSDFGWGRPVKVKIVTIDRNGAISMSESSDGDGGVEIGLCLKRDEMDAFALLFIDGLKN